MNDALATLVPIAVVVGLSPIPVIQMILVIFSERRVPNMLAFVTGLVFSTIAVIAIGIVTFDAAYDSEESSGRFASLVLAGVGAFLFATGVKYWRDRANVSEPELFKKIATMGPAAATVLSLSAVFANPKNLVLLLAAGQTIAEAEAGSAATLTAVFVAVSASPYVFSTVYALAGGQAANANLDRAREWLIRRNRAITGVIGIVLGAYLAAKGVAGL